MAKKEKTLKVVDKIPTISLDEGQKKQIAALQTKMNQAKSLLLDVALEELRTQSKKNQVVQIISGIENDFAETLKVMARSLDIDIDSPEAKDWTFDINSLSFIKKTA